MALIESAAGAGLRWFKRSIERRYGDERDQWDEDARLQIGFGLSHHQVLDAPDDGDSASYHIELRVELELADQDITAELSCAVQFRFVDVSAPGRKEIEEFLRDHALEYVLGFVRAAVADQTRLIGMPTAMLPIRTPSWDEVLPMLFDDDAEASDDAPPAGIASV
ncbi:hypothetical protein EF294_03115 [Gordonia oryzae]|uniref:Preprotein translocase subunit SecB n=1 Tax=Gordonia oryzae TaxID=2487349 RepID=A0A3N4GS08_9ACTN|nr:hypothetical protein [Gordonia oryzae]RPA65743.1 hypothetical protein EF294_03115 [Gordonia oryzae]